MFSIYPKNISPSYNSLLISLYTTPYLFIPQQKDIFLYQTFSTQRIGVVPGTDGRTDLLYCVNSFSKWPEAIAAMIPAVKMIVDILTNPELDLPYGIHSDQGILSIDPQNVFTSIQILPDGRPGDFQPGYHFLPGRWFCSLEEVSIKCITGPFIVMF
ncbi:hypothetical protein RF11_07864 [Thelohanellus kitauei]|uniref:Uncharacterized protein n=1 Tax=Thelohanellus kitauei TaxID=669202 RepID=A0A0C2M866_THEKT|nr:hypothetical protein RF11_07864 [Thelohanellus kitauei]